MDYRPGEKTSAGYLALPPSGKGPGVLVLHAWWGLNEFFTGLCDRLAAEGYVALAPDLYGGAIATTIPEAESLRDRESDATEGQVLEALDALRAHPAAQGEKVGVVGCSMGVWWSMRLSVLRPDQIAAAVFFYGAVDGDFAAARCAYQGHYAEDDTWDPVDLARDMEAKMRAAGRDVSIHVYPGVGHWFFESNVPDAYNAEAASLAWERTVAFLNEHLRSGA